MATSETDRNKDVVRRFFAEVGAGNIDVLDEVVAEDYIQHNPHAGQGRSGLRTFLEQMMQGGGMPDLKPEAELYIAEDDYVVYQGTFRDGVITDVFRVHDGMLREHWDSYRPNPGTERWPGF